MAFDPEFDWDEGNVAHLRRHRISPHEFEQVILNDPFELEYEVGSGEDRYKALGMTVQDEFSLSFGLHEKAVCAL